MFLIISNNLFDLSLLLNICYIMFVICDTGPSCLSGSDVFYLLRLQDTRSQVTGIVIDIRNFLQRDIKILLFFSKLLICISYASVVDNSTLQPYSVRVAFARIEGKVRLNIYTVLSRLFICLKCTVVPACRRSLFI